MMRIVDGNKLDMLRTAILCASFNLLQQRCPITFVLILGKNHDLFEIIRSQIVVLLKKADFKAGDLPLLSLDQAKRIFDGHDLMNSLVRFFVLSAAIFVAVIVFHVCFRDYWHILPGHDCILHRNPLNAYPSA